MSIKKTVKKKVKVKKKQNDIDYVNIVHVYFTIVICV